MHNLTITIHNLDNRNLQSQIWLQKYPYLCYSWFQRSLDGTNKSRHWHPQSKCRRYDKGRSCIPQTLQKKKRIWILSHTDICQLNQFASTLIEFQESFISFHFISFIISQGTKKSSYKTKQTLKMQTCSNDTMITQDTIIQSKTSWQYPL